MQKLALFSKTVVASVLTAIGYGLIHDQITIRICPQYFTIWHPFLFNGEQNNLTLLALCWGVIATWWFGLFLALILGGLAVAGPRPLPPFRFVLRTICRILIWTAFGAALAGIAAWLTKAQAPTHVMGDVLYRLGPDFRRRFTIDLFIHNASYDVAPIAAIVYGLLLLKRRKDIVVATGH